MMMQPCVKLRDQEIHLSESFWYLGSILRKDGGIDKDVNHRVQAGWFNWKSVSVFLCDRKVPLKVT